MQDTRGRIKGHGQGSADVKMGKGGEWTPDPADAIIWGGTGLALGITCVSQICFLRKIRFLSEKNE